MSTPIVLASTTSSSVSAWNGIPYGELVEGWTLTGNNNSPSEATRSLVVSGSNLDNMMDYLLGTNNYTTSTGFVTTYIVGEKHPRRNVYCDSVSVVPSTGVAPAVSTHDQYTLNCHYRSLPFDVGSPAVIREDAVELCGKIYHIPGEVQTYTVGIGPVGINRPAQSVYQPRLKITSTLLGVSTVPLGTIIAKTAHISSSDLTFNFGGATYTITGNTILYAGASSKRTVLSNGVSKYDVTHTFLLSPVHNKFLDASLFGTGATSLDALFTASGDGYTNYPATSFAGLGV